VVIHPYLQFSGRPLVKLIKADKFAFVHAFLGNGANSLALSIFAKLMGFGVHTVLECGPTTALDQNHVVKSQAVRMRTG
jgi:hypothetical protein